jgi:hypothetical protein
MLAISISRCWGTDRRLPEVKTNGRRSYGGDVRANERVPDFAQERFNSGVVGRETVCDLWIVGVGGEYGLDESKDGIDGPKEGRSVKHTYVNIDS